MALGDIVERIIADARADADQARAEGGRRAREILAAAQVEARARTEAALRSRAGELRAAMDNRLAVVRLEARKKTLALKRELVGQVFEEAAAGLTRRPAGEYAQLLATLVTAAVAVEPGEVQLARGDLERCGAALPQLVFAALAARHPGWRFTVSAETGDFEAGLLVRAGRSLYDLSLVTLLAERRERWEIAVNQALLSA